jgi:peptidoglycan/xylan/chitin deacetylase (PgdA/CDA1 family)
MIGIILDNPLDCRSAYTFEFFFSIMGVPFELIEKGHDRDHDLVIHYGWEPQKHDWMGRPVISIPPYARLIDSAKGSIPGLREQWPPLITACLRLGDERVPFYYPFVPPSEGEILYCYEMEEGTVVEGGAVVEEGKVVRLGFDIVASAFYLLNLEEERRHHSSPQRRRRKAKEQQDRERIIRRDLLQPTVDRYVKLLRGLIERCYHREGLPFVSTCPWPYGKKFAVCLSHDVDRVYTREMLTVGVALYKILRDFLKGDFRKAFSDVHRLVGSFLQRGDRYWNFERWMALESAYDVRSTFYFMEGRRVGLYGRRYNCQKLKALLHRLHKEGWEVGLHGGYYSWQDSERRRKEKMTLERTLGDRLSGHRQHYLRFDPDRSYRVSQEAGFDYDTTLGYNDRVGYRAGTSFPFVPYEPLQEIHRQLSPPPRPVQSGRSMHVGDPPESLPALSPLHRNGSYPRFTQMHLLEIPLIVMDRGLVLQGLSSKTGFLRSFLEKTEIEEGCLSILWHECAFDDYEYPGWSDPGWREEYEGVLRYVTDHDGWAATGREMTAWWRARNGCRYRVRTLPDPDTTTIVTLESIPPEGLCFRVLLPDGEERIIEGRSGEWHVGAIRVIIEERLSVSA